VREHDHRQPGNTWKIFDVFNNLNLVS
jgi:hypothetical protein